MGSKPRRQPRKLAWHFISADRTLRDGRTLVIGEWLEHDGRLELCRSGLHASTRAIDALRYAPGPVICRVEIAGTIIRDNDKVVCTRRRPLAAVDATDTLRRFARLCALDVIDLWNAPPIVREYLKTGDESIRDAARAAARDAAWAAVRDAVRDAAWAAARAAARAAAWAAVRAAAKDAAWAAAKDAARAAAKDAARAAQNKRLERMLSAALEGE